MKLKGIVALLTILVGITVGSTFLQEKATSGAGLQVEAEEKLETLKENSDFVLEATVDGNYETRKIIEDKEHDVYQIRRLYTATIHKSIKGKEYDKGDLIEVVYPIGMKQISEGHEDGLLPFSDETIEMDTGEYLLFLDDLKGQLFRQHKPRLQEATGSSLFQHRFRRGLFYCAGKPRECGLIVGGKAS
ncbi:hypothetical protein [Halobacillus salinus]|uniref:Uncharacterized protein n=1 Tax=Halobacillus salinus TaxID=192814 RepID=A0A4Z0GY00_9BACI|nr:hypothetical protein [Halobacillus salinus]TGB01459.1 hypothetical protein E4663_16800 [Halobacillus salinus]